MDEEFYLEDLKSKFKKINPKEYYLSYSGGKDSHFLYWFIKEYLHDNDIEIVGVNTYMEHHEILNRILKNCDVVLFPALKPLEIKEKYGIPCFSKFQDEMISRYQNGSRTKNTMEAITGENRVTFKLNKKARELTLSGKLHKVSNKCCKIIKKDTLHRYEKESGRKAILGVRGSESSLRKSKYKTCFTKDKKFTPIHDLDNELFNKIIEKYNIEVPEVYKHIDRTGCFTPDVEVCTNEGFKRLDNLEGNEKILTISDEGKKEFRNYKKVEFDFEGELIKVKLQNKEVYATPDHRFLGYNRDKKIWESKEAEHISRLSIPSNMRYKEDNTQLGILEKIYIATQADGSLTRKDNKYIFDFCLKKERKITRLKSLLINANLKYRESKKVNGVTKISVSLDRNAKDLWNCFDIESIGVSKAKQIIEEMVLWDGHKDKNKRMRFYSTNKNQVNFYAFISSIAGYSHYQYSIPKRKSNWNKEHILMIYKKHNRNYKQETKLTKYYKGKVHCVDIGGRLCVFRKDGKTFVAYNCMGCPYGSFGGNTQKELGLISENQKRFVCEYFKESYEVLGIDTNIQKQMTIDEYL